MYINIYMYRIIVVYNTIKHRCNKSYTYIHKNTSLCKEMNHCR